MSRSRDTVVRSNTCEVSFGPLFNRDFFTIDTIDDGIGGGAIRLDEARDFPEFEDWKLRKAELSL